MSVPAVTSFGLFYLFISQSAAPSEALLALAPTLR
jgi:hypothetical protein